jgi:hypothetical protein
MMCILTPIASLHFLLNSTRTRNLAKHAKRANQITTSMAA